MNKLHQPHQKSGYIAKVDFQQTTDRDGKADWIMFYQPGPKARAEFKTFTKRGGPSVVEIEPLPPEPLPLLAGPQPSPLEIELVERGITPATAAVLVRQHDAERITTQIEVLDWLEAKKPGKITDTAAWLVIAIKNGHAVPKGFESKAVRQRREEARLAKEREVAEAKRRKQQDAAQEEADRKAVDAYLKQLSPDQRVELEAKALQAASPESRANLEMPLMHKFRETLLLAIVREYLGPILRDQKLAFAQA